MSKSNAWETGILGLLFNATPIANVADDAGTSPLTNLYVALHTAQPSESGDQTSNETAYTGYARFASTRDTNASTGWAVSGNSVSPQADWDFGECTASPGAPLTHMSVGSTASGAGVMFYWGSLSPNITVATGVIPRLKNTSTITED